MRHLLRVLDFSDQDFYGTFRKLFIPIMAQKVLSSSLILIDSIMIGYLGEVEIAAVGLANQLYILFFMCLLGISSGTSIFVAQLWGKRDSAQIYQVQGLSLICALSLALLGLIIGRFFPSQFISLYNNDAEVLGLGIKYLRIVCLGYVFHAITQIYSSILKSCNIVKLPVIAAAIGMATNTVLNYILIFGKLGLPALGVEGAAIATLLAYVVECAVVVIYTYKNNLPSAVTLNRMFPLRGLLSRYVKVTLPVMFNEFGWGVTTTAYMMIYGILGKQTIAAMQIFGSMDRLFFMIYVGMATACSIMCGNLIGQGRRDTAVLYAKRYLIIGIFCSIIGGAVVAACGSLLLEVYNISSYVKGMTSGVIRLFGCAIWLYTISFISISGILRSGGDTLYASICEVAPMLLVSIPTVYILGVIFHTPLWVAYLGAVLGELIKAIAALIRFRSGKWICDVTTGEQVRI